MRPTGTDQTRRPHQPAPTGGLSCFKRKASQRDRQRIGAVTESTVHARLVAAGLMMVEKVEVGWRLQRGPGGRILRAWPAAKVSGDFRAIQPVSGRAVLVEVKHREDGQLSLGDLEKHQRDALDATHAAGGIALVALVTDTGCYLMRWPLEGLRRGHPIHESQAGAYAWP